MVLHRAPVDVFSLATDSHLDKTTRNLSNGHRLSMTSHPRLAFDLDEYQRRYELVLSHMERDGLDVLLVRGPENITYLSGFETPGYYKYHCIIVTPDHDPIFVIRSYESPNVPEFSWIFDMVVVEEIDHPPALTAGTLLDLGLNGKRIGVEKQGFYYTVDEHETLTRALPDATFIDASAVMWDARMIKSPAEVAMMKRSSTILDHVMKVGWEASRPGVSADAISAEVNREIFAAGGEYMGLPPFALASERSCLPHQTGGANVLGDNDVMFFEISVSQRRYCCARMYTIFLGEPPQEMTKCASVLIDGVGEALDFIKPGRTSEECDSHVRNYISNKGFGEHYRNRLGYSIGVNYPPDWGEGEVIALRQGEERELQPGMTFHMPPTNMKYREYGIGYSESILVTDDGCEKFSQLPLELIVKA